MLKTFWIGILLGLSLFALTGCGSGFQSLTGGSVPIGGRAVTGTVLLPDGTAVAASPVTVRSLPSGSVLGTSMTDVNGRFTVSGVPTNGDISVVVTQPPSNILEAVVPRTSLAANPDSPLDIGAITALTTVVAAAIHLEHGPAPEDEERIVANQEPPLLMHVHDAHYSVEMQNQFIGDRNSLNAQALTLIVPTANSELAAFAAQPGTDTAAAALNGLLGYVRAAHKRGIRLNDANRNGLIDAQLAGKIYSPETIVAALHSANVAGATTVQVTSASLREHTELAALADLGAGITPFEALVIAADVDTHGGFQLEQRSLDTFLMELLKR